MTDASISAITVAVQEDHNGDCYLIFPDNFLQQLGWSEGDVINWEVDDVTGQITVRKAAAQGPMGP
jgi:hypothetical protein